MPWRIVITVAAVVLSVLLLFLYMNRETTVPLQPSTELPSSVRDTVFLASPSQTHSHKDTPLPAFEEGSDQSYVIEKPLTIVSGSVDTQAIVVRRQRTDSILYAMEQGKIQAQNALEMAIYNFKFTIDSMFKPVDLYIKSDEVKTSNILRDLIYIAEYKTRIRECQIRCQLPKSERNSFFNYANDRIEAKKRSYTQKYPTIIKYPNEQQVREPEKYQQSWEQSQKYQQEGTELYMEWKRLMNSIH